MLYFVHGEKPSVIPLWPYSVWQRMQVVQILEAAVVYASFYRASSYAIPRY